MRIEPFAYLLGSADPWLEIDQETGFPERPCRYVRVLTGPRCHLGDHSVDSAHGRN
jgi:hypothetical protein